MKWNVFMENFNLGKIEIFNIFNSARFYEGVKKLVKKNLQKDEFSKELKSELMYSFWGKCEYEIIIADYPTFITVKELERLNEERKNDDEKNKKRYRYGVNLDVEKKVDIYEQVMLNWSVFLEYVWENKKEILKSK